MLQEKFPPDEFLWTSCSSNRTCSNTMPQFLFSHHPWQRSSEGIYGGPPGGESDSSAFYEQNAATWRGWPTLPSRAYKFPHPSWRELIPLQDKLHPLCTPWLSCWCLGQGLHMGVPNTEHAGTVLGDWLCPPGYEGHAADSVEGMSSVYISGPEAPRVAQPHGDVGYWEIALSLLPHILVWSVSKLAKVFCLGVGRVLSLDPWCSNLCLLVAGRDYIKNCTDPASAWTGG